MQDMDIGAYLERAVRLFPNNLAVVCGDDRLTYQELFHESITLATGFETLGLSPGDRVVELRYNSAESLIYEYACAFAGLVRVPLTPRLMPAEIPQLINATGARAVCTTAEHKHLADAANVEFVIADGMDGALARRDISKEPVQARTQIDPDALCALRHTGGTTGIPKAAMQTHHGQIPMAAALLLEFVDLRTDDLLLVTQPYTHGGGMFTVSAAMRGTGLLLQPAFDADAALDAIEANRATIVKFVPTILYRLLEAQRKRPRDLASLRLMCYGAAPMPEQLLNEAMEVFECEWSQTYGQAEAPATIACLGPREHKLDPARRGQLLHSVGRPYPMVNVVIVGPDDQEVAPGEIGEVTVAGAITTPGYWNRPDLTETLLRNGRVHTGDLGRFEDGFLYLVGRSSEAIITGGFNVYPAEVERVLLSLEGVRDAAVTAVPDAEWGERVVAAVVLEADSALSSDEIRTRCRSQLAGYKCPKDLKVVDEVPLTANSKVDKKAIQKLFELVDGAAGF